MIILLHLLAITYNHSLSLMSLYSDNSCEFGVTEDGVISSDEELSGGDHEVAEDGRQRCEDRDLKDRLLRKFGSRISTLKLEFSKKKKKGKLPREARQALLDWWNLHYKWPYPTVSKSNTCMFSDITNHYTYI